MPDLGLKEKRCGVPSMPHPVRPRESGDPGFWPNTGSPLSRGRTGIIVGLFPNIIVDIKSYNNLCSCRPIRPRASSRDVPKMGSDAAPAGGARNPAPGGPGQAVRPHYDGLPSMAGCAGREGWREPPGLERPKASSADPARKCGLRGLKNAACGAPRGASPRSQAEGARPRTACRVASPAAQEGSHPSAFPGAPPLGIEGRGKGRPASPRRREQGR